MGWSIGYGSYYDRDIGYAVPAYCDHPKCNKKIDRGLSYVCGGEPYGGEKGCGLYFCGEHLEYYNKRIGLIELCYRCGQYKQPYKPKPEHPEWIAFKLTDSSWAEWRKENPEKIKMYKKLLER